MESVESVQVEKDDVPEEQPTKNDSEPVVESSVGINGDKEMDADDTSSEDNKDAPVEQSKTSENDKEPDDTTTKKRKYDDMKDSDGSEDSSTNEFLGFAGTNAEEDTTKPSEEKKDKQEKMKSDILTFDSAFGKGKRSRIPNKKYEGLTLKSLTKSLKSDHFESDSGAEVTSSEDGRNDEESDAHKVEDSSDVSNSTNVSAKSKPSKPQTSTPSQPPPKKPKITHDMSNPAYRKPFEFGWKRELVYRAIPDQNNMKRNGDIYYITPSGKKVRSMREVSENLDNKELSLEDFTFFKEPIGLNDPEKEIIRDAKLKGSPNPASVKKLTPKARAAKEKSLMKSISSPSELPASSKSSKSPKLGGFKVKFPGTSRLSQSAQKKSNRGDSHMDSSMLPPSWTSKRTSKHATWQPRSGGDSDEPSANPKTCSPCSLRCQGLFGIVPNLQCRLCLCLYHNECVGLSSDNRTDPTYVCKNCQLDSPEQSSSSEILPSLRGPPPLTPISQLISTTAHPTSPPKLQRIPRPGDTTYVPPPIVHLPPRAQLAPKHPDPPRTYVRSTPVQRYVKAPEAAGAPSSEAGKSILGSVTTWFPPSSTIQVNSNDKSLKETVTALRPQGLVYMGDRKFLVVPRTNVLSVSPALGAAASTPSSTRITSPTADKAPVFEAKERSKSADAVDDSNTPASASLGPAPTTGEASPPPITLVPPVEPDPSAPLTFSNTQTAKLIVEELKASPQKTQSNAASPETSPSKSRRSLPRKTTTTTPVSAPKVEVDTKFTQNFMQNMSYGYQTLLHVFQYLKVQDLLRAGCVCTMWRDLATHPTLWRTVRLKNSQVSNWDGLAEALIKHRTETLDLRKVLLSSNGEDIWPSFLKAIARVHSLLRIDLCKCPASVVEEVAKTNRHLQVINALSIRCDSIDLSSINQLVNLQELRIKSANGLTLKSDLTPLKELTQLKHLSLTSIKDLNKTNIEVISELVRLESLDLGECNDFPESFGTDVLSKLVCLEKLRLEKGLGTCATFTILEEISKLPKLEQLELVNFDVKAGFDKALGACTNIKKLLIIPTYISQSATTNHMVLGGVMNLKDTLSQFVWGVTLELIRVTELFMDQCEDTPPKEKKKPSGLGGSIPVLKPVPIMNQSEDDDKEEPSKDSPQVEILPLATLQKLLLNCLPKTRVKILKVPFLATWRQSIVDSSN